MKNHKVVDIKITYEPENMHGEKKEALEKTIEQFLEDLKDTQGVRITAKRHNVSVDVLMDEYGIDGTSH